MRGSLGVIMGMQDGGELNECVLSPVTCSSNVCHRTEVTGAMVMVIIITIKPFECAYLESL